MWGDKNWADRFRWLNFAPLLDEARAFLKNIRLKELPRIPIGREDFASDLPTIPAVYFVSRVGEKRPLYVGRTTNLKKRWMIVEEFGERIPKKDHHKLKTALRHKNIELRWLKVPREHLLVVEILMIQIYKPKWNVQGKGKPSRPAPDPSTTEV